VFRKKKVEERNFTDQIAQAAAVRRVMVAKLV
jgi:hypothetical protein